MNPIATTAPFVGLRPFDSGDQYWFKGRSRETKALTRKVRGSRFTAVVGASGSGKSSLVRAGVLPQLSGDGWVTIIAKPGSAPITMLADALAHVACNTENDDLAYAQRYRFSSTLRSSAYGLADLARVILPEAARLVLVIDQFEELFRYGEEAQGVQKAAMQEESRAFVELLLTATAQADSRLHVIVTMRSDFFGNCSAYAGLAEAISDSQYLVPLPGRDDLEQVIRLPVNDAGATIDDALVQRLLIDMEEQVDRLPTLQHTLRRLWDKAEGEPKHLSEQGYKIVGGMAGSIDRKAEQIRLALEKANALDGFTLERIMKALTTLDDQVRATRRPQKKSELLALLKDSLPLPRNKKPLSAQEADVGLSLDRILEAFAEEDASFLMLGQSDDPEVDIGHEALIRSWHCLCGQKRDFKTGWLYEERGDGRQWRELVSRTELIRQPPETKWWRIKAWKFRQLQTITEWWRTRSWIKHSHVGKIWSARYGNAWEDVEALRHKSIVKHAAIGFVALTVFSLFIYGLVFWALSSQKEAKKQETEALRFARAGALAAAGYSQSFTHQGNARLGALVALEVLPESRSPNDPRFVPEVESALYHALTVPIERLRLQGHNSQVTGAVFTPDGRRIVSVSLDKTIRLWDAATGEPVGPSFPKQNEALASVAISPDGKRIATGDSYKVIRIWNVITGELIGQPLSGHTEPVLSVAFSPDGSTLVSSSGDTTLSLWNTTTGEKVGQRLEGHGGDVLSVAFSPDGLRIVSGSVDMTLRIWDVATGSVIGKPLQGHEGYVTSVAFSPDGRFIVSGSEDGTLRRWDAVTGAPVDEPMRGSGGRVSSVAFSPDGGRIV
ncbi:MAG: NACHT and WD repeat domain-containing protein, partial [Candidatus Methylumidiphilus sp.]